MKTLVSIFLITIFFLTGCATKNPVLLKYQRSNKDSLDRLYDDLESGKLQGATLDYVLNTYGAAASLTEEGGKTLIIYRRPRYQDSAYIWFDKQKKLESWSN